MTDPTSPPAEREIAGIPLRLFGISTAIAAVLAVAAGVLVSMASDQAEAPAGATMTLEPDTAVLGAPVAVTYTTFDDDVANTGSYVGRPLVVNFFAEWCAPCVAEMPEFEEVYQDVGDDVAFLGLSSLEPVDKALEIIDLTGITYDVGRDADGSAFQVFGGVGMPTTAFIDATGVVLEVHTGPLDAPQLRSRIEQHFG